MFIKNDKWDIVSLLANLVLLKSKEISLEGARTIKIKLSSTYYLTLSTLESLNSILKEIDLRKGTKLNLDNYDAEDVEILKCIQFIEDKNYKYNLFIEKNNEIHANKDLFIYLKHNKIIDAVIKGINEKLNFYIHMRDTFSNFEF